GPRRQLPGRFRVGRYVHRLARQDGTQDRAQAEHVGAFIDLVDGANRLFGRHVRRCAQHRARPGLRAVLLGPGADFGDGRWGARGVVWASGPGRTLARPQSMTWTSPKAPTMTLAGLRSLWMTRWA